MLTTKTKYNVNNRKIKLRKSQKDREWNRNSPQRRLLSRLVARLDEIKDSSDSDSDSDSEGGWSSTSSTATSSEEGEEDEEFLEKTSRIEWTEKMSEDKHLEVRSYVDTSR